MSESSSYATARNLLRDEPDLHPFLIALFQFGVAPAGGEFWGSSLLNRVQRHDNWAGQQPRRLGRLGLLRVVQPSKGWGSACYAVVDPAGIRRALTDHGLDPRQKLPGDFFNHVAKIDRAAAEAK
jgi:hypothetical protein